MQTPCTSTILTLRCCVIVVLDLVLGTKYVLTGTFPAIIYIGLTTYIAPDS